MNYTRITYSYKEYGPNDVDDDYPTGNTCTLVVYPTAISDITVKFFDPQTLQQPNTDIYYNVEIGFKPINEKSNPEIKLRIVMRVDEQYNYTVCPEKVISNITGFTCLHEKYELSDQHHEEVKNAIKSFLTKIRGET